MNNDPSSVFLIFKLIEAKDNVKITIIYAYAGASLDRGD
jgi:hypothetical protein